MRRFRPVAILTAVAAVSALAAGLSARAATPSLPAISPDRLVASTLRALRADRPVSGQLLAHVELGLPSLPDQGPHGQGGPARLLEAINGDHRVRLWSSEDGRRISELLPAAEISFVLRRMDDRAEAWAWDSRSFTAVHVGPVTASEPPGQPHEMLDPLQVARRMLSGVSATTKVDLGPNAMVAGRPAYVLRIEPRSAETLIGRIEISIDGERRIPLRVAVLARGAGSPALSLGFNSVSFGPVDPGVYRFSPPPGATVRELGGSAGRAVRSEPTDTEGRTHEGAGPEEIGEYVRTFGQAWTTVVAYRIPSPAEAGREDGLDLGALLPFSGPLFSARLVERGDRAWLMVGAVPQSRLAALEPQLP